MGYLVVLHPYIPDPRDIREEGWTQMVRVE